MCVCACVCLCLSVRACMYVCMCMWPVLIVELFLASKNYGTISQLDE